MRAKLQKVTFRDSNWKVRTSGCELVQQDCRGVYCRNRTTSLRQGYGVHPKTGAEVQHRHLREDGYAQCLQVAATKFNCPIKATGHPEVDGTRCVE